MSRPADEARIFLKSHTYGVLSTFLHHENNEFPFGSLVAYNVDDSGDIIIKTAIISEHHRNILENPHASMFVMGGGDAANVQGEKRITFIVYFKEVPSGEVPEVRNRFLERFPDMIPPEIEEGFRYWQGRVVKVRWISGFGKMGWLSSEDYYQAL